MTGQVIWRLAVGIVAVITFGFMASSASADVSFQGKTVRMTISASPGGTTDRNARRIGTLIVEYLPGNPQIVFRNDPAVRGIRANNYFYASIKPDGLTVLSGSRTQVSPYKLRHPRVQYDPSKYRFVGGTVRLGTVILANGNALPRLMAADAKPLSFGCVDGERTGSLAAVWAAEYLGWNIRFMVGYSGTRAMSRAFRRGEIDLFHNQAIVNLMPLIKQGFVPVVQVGDRDANGRMVARPGFREVPVLGDLIRDKLDAKATKAYQTWLNDQAIEKWVALPPGTPAAYVAAWRAAYGKVMTDPGFVALAKREFGGDFGWLNGHQMNGIVRSLVATTDADLAFFTALRAKHGLPVQ